ncbi:MAG TPA: protein kinase [Bryobacteraceae bacterium]|nr:protein kinase [Bryobacteraceae bacterium]
MEPTSNTPPAAGEILGHYRILAKIGQGGMGVVYRAHDEVLHRDVALKILTLDRGDAESSREFLLAEARASSALAHPNICTIHEVADFGGELAIVMELVEGRPLSSLIESRALTIESVLRYGRQIAAALAHAHGRGVVHRDLKSSNVVVNPEGLVKVLDFGLARRLPAQTLEAVTQSLGSLAGPRTIAGTLSHMPPEVLRGEPGDHLTDLWAFGVLLHEAVSGQLPFPGSTIFEVTSAILQQPPSPLPSSVPPSVTAIIQKCLAKDPAQRYQQAAELQAALDNIQAAAVVPAPSPAEPRGPLTLVHRGIRHLAVRSGDVLLLVGTTKGAFLLRSTRQRSRWEVAGPYFHGQAIYALAYDSRAGRRRLWAATHTFWGTFLRSSDDFGKTWTNPLEANIKFPADTGTSLANIWQICPGSADEPETLYCGVEPAALFESRDGGDSWALVRGLFDHPHRPRWVPGNGGLCLHTIIPDPAAPGRMYVAISAAGVYRTDDGGRTWEARNRGVRVVYHPDRYPEFGQCVHKIVLHPACPDRLYLQNHWGLYRSDDGAATWRDIANGVPSDFGFAMTVHPHDPDCVYIVPIESDEFRCTPEGRLRVYRTRNGGSSWEPLMQGLPQKRAYETVLRDALTTDPLDPVGVYFGTRNGQVYASANEGKNWTKIVDGFPPIVCVKAVLNGEPRQRRGPKS